jgi:serine protease
VALPPARPMPIMIIETPMPARTWSRQRNRAALVLAAAFLCCAAPALEPGLAGASIGAGMDYSATHVVVGYGPPTAAGAAAGAAASRSGEGGEATHVREARVGRGEAVPAAVNRLRHERGVRWAVPDYRAHLAGAVIPNDRGSGALPGDWQQLQWNFAGPFGVNAPEAWANVTSAGAPGGQGVVVAVLDTGVAYTNRGAFRRSPDFSRFSFVAGYDFVAGDAFPSDRNGHGTFVASTIAEASNNAFGLTGLAFGARIMPVRVLDGQGEGEASTIAEGVRYAVNHGARVINLSLEFSSNVTASDIPELIQSLRYARRHGVFVAAAAGNEAHTAIAYPARVSDVVAVGATTEHGCLADYSNDGSGLTLVAPGGGADANLPGDPNCHPEQPAGRDIFQVTFTGSSPRRFGIPTGYEGTSMAAPHVSAAAALVIASGVLGRRPSPAQVTARLRATARKLGGGGDERLYGAGLLDAGAATASGGPAAPVR